jgi:hypothetical protein
MNDETFDNYFYCIIVDYVNEKIGKDISSNFSSMVELLKYPNKNTEITKWNIDGIEKPTREQLKEIYNMDKVKECQKKQREKSMMNTLCGRNKKKIEELQDIINQLNIKITALEKKLA